jgi:signal transduction histidine kinase/CheY-like chemotaxis protein
MHSFIRKIQRFIIRYAQAAAVLSAFALMAVLSCLFVSDIERKHVQKNVKDAIVYAEDIIKADMSKTETVLEGTAGLADRIRQRIVNMKFTENGYGFLLNENMELIAHPEPSIPGMTLHDLKGRIAPYEDELKQKGFISERIMTDYQNIKSIVFIEKLQNGWYMGVATPRDEYYQETKKIILIFVVIGTLTMAILGCFLSKNTPPPPPLQSNIQDYVDVNELITAKEQAIQANNAKSSFLAKISHEIRTPINVILGITEIQLRDETLPPDIQESMGTIYNSGNLLLGIVNDILDMSKIEAGRLQITPADYDVAGLINDIIYLNVIWYDYKPVEFSLQVDENIPVTLFGDELRIKQILNNLLSNAFKYTESGRISLSISIEYTGKEDQITLVFRVSDTGQGMTAKQTKILFDEYTRFNTESNRNIEGTGLGMSITKSLVQLMNGEIAVESDPGKGSAFTVRLPQKVVVGSGMLGRETVENLMQFRHNRISTMKRMPHITREYMPYGKVLIVDDMEINLHVTEGLLAPYGLSIETATNGFEVINRIKNGASWDIIFMDHFIPKMDGMETVKIIRTLGYTQPIVALTANAMTGQTQMFLANVFDDFIPKPVDLRQLNAVLNRLIRDKYPAETVEAARWVRKNRKKHPAIGDIGDIGAAPQSSTDAELAEHFTRDARRAITVLEAIHANNYRTIDDIPRFIFNLCAIKNTLTDIGETALSAAASNLEQAGRKGDTAFMQAEVPVFLDSLRELIEKIRSKDKNNGLADAVSDDAKRAYLREKLLFIQTACTAYDERGANTTLGELRQQTWPPPVRKLLTAIAGHLLHSEFEAAAALAGDYTQKT